MSLQFSPEYPIIRPPNEWRSLLVRLTRGCKWNRCRFCGIYPHLGEPNFSVRTVAAVKHDIDLLRGLRPDAETAFFGDADPLQIGTENFREIAVYLRNNIPIKRLTCYARASTLFKLKNRSLKLLADAGLNRVHIGLESGDPKTLHFHRKGQSPDMIMRTTAMLKDAGIEVSFYVLLGLGGIEKWKSHILATAELINETAPDFVRIRRLWLYGGDSLDSGSGSGRRENPLWQQIRVGSFIPQTPEGTVLELKLLLENLDELNTYMACDHQNNYVQISGLLRDNKAEMLAEIDAFLALPAEEKESHYLDAGGRI